MKSFHPIHARAARWGALLIAGGLGCASTQVTSSTEYAGRLPKPERILVYRFAMAPDEVRLDHSVTAAAAWQLHGTTKPEEKDAVAGAVADTLAKELVKKIQALGLPAELAEGPPSIDGRPTLVIDGQFLPIDEGSRTARVVIGLGAGRSDVRTAVQVHEIVFAGRRLVDQFEVDAKSGSLPGPAGAGGGGAAAEGGGGPSPPRSSVTTSKPTRAGPRPRSPRSSPRSLPERAGSRPSRRTRSERSLLRRVRIPARLRVVVRSQLPDQVIDLGERIHGGLEELRPLGVHGRVVPDLLEAPVEIPGLLVTLPGLEVLRERHALLVDPARVLLQPEEGLGVARSDGLRRLVQERGLDALGRGGQLLRDPGHRRLIPLREIRGARGGPDQRDPP